ncbi:MAG: ATP-binding protein [Bacteroidales bacterium]
MEENIKLLEKHNLWGNSSLDYGYNWDYYTNNITDCCGNRLIKVLVGQRRSGKSYILRQIARSLVKEKGVDVKNTLFISREFIDFDFIKTYVELNDIIKLYLQELKPVGKVYIFIDEIQSIDAWERVVNSYSQDFTAEYELFISGSNSKMLSGELATLLSGRYLTFEIFPFSYNEFLDVKDLTSNKDSYLEYMKSSGLPELFSIDKEQLKRNYVSAIKDTVLLRDIIQRYNIRDPKMLEDIFIFLINNISNLISINSIVKYFKGLGRKSSYDGVSNYIGFIEDTYMIHRCNRYDIKGKDIISGNAKYYSNDLAYKNYLFMGYGYGVGYMLENLVYLELRRAGYQVYVGNIKDKEIDFVALKGDDIKYLQVAYMLVEESTIEREYSSLEAIDDNYDKIVITLDDLNYPPRKGIKHIQAWNLPQYLK